MPLDFYYSGNFRNNSIKYHITSKDLNNLVFRYSVEDVKGYLVKESG